MPFCVLRGRRTWFWWDFFLVTHMHHTQKLQGRKAFIFSCFSRLCTSCCHFPQYSRHTQKHTRKFQSDLLCIYKKKASKNLCVKGKGGCQECGLAFLSVKQYNTLIVLKKSAPDFRGNATTCLRYVNFWPVDLCALGCVMRIMAVLCSHEEI